MSTRGWITLIFIATLCSRSGVSQGWLCWRVCQLLTQWCAWRETRACPGLPCFYCAKHSALLWNRAVTNISCKHFHCAEGKHTLQTAASRGVYFYVQHMVELLAAGCHGAKSMWRWSLEHIHGELVYSELAVRCTDLDVNGGHSAVPSWEVMGVMEEDCSIPSQCRSCIYLYTFNVHHRLQLETRYWATWILINLLVDILPPYFTRLTHPENNVELWQ